MKKGMIVYCGEPEGFAEDQKKYAEALAQIGLTASFMVEDVLRMCDVNSLRENTGWVIVTSGTHPKPFDTMELTSKILREFVSTVIQEGLPMFGVARASCAIAASFGGDVEDHAERGEAGVVEVYRLHPATEDHLFDDAPETFRAVAYRNDDIMQLPVQCVPMANSKLSQFHIYKVAGKPVYGLQFDPLLSLITSDLTQEEKEFHTEIIRRWLALGMAE